MSPVYAVFCLQGLPATKAEHGLEGSEELGLSPLDLWQFALSFLNRLPQLLATDYINEGPSQKAYSPSEAVGKRGGKEKQRKRKCFKGVRASPWAPCSSCCSCCCSAVGFSHVSTASYLSAFWCFIYEPVNKMIMQKSTGEWLIVLERASVAKI